MLKNGFFRNKHKNCVFYVKNGVKNNNGKDFAFVSQCGLTALWLVVSPAHTAGYIWRISSLNFACLPAGRLENHSLCYGINREPPPRQSQNEEFFSSFEFIINRSCCRFY